MICTDGLKTREFNIITYFGIYPLQWKRKNSQALSVCVAQISDAILFYDITGRTDRLYNVAQEFIGNKGSAYLLDSFKYNIARAILHPALPEERIANIKYVFKSFLVSWERPQPKKELPNQLLLFKSAKTLTQ